MEQVEKEMNEFSEEQRNSVRKYLLGSLDDKAEMRRIEKKILFDDDFADQLSIAEDELVEDYLDGMLTEPERERFLRFFLVAPENKEKLRLVENLRKYAAESGAPLVENTLQQRSRLFDWRNLYAPPLVFRFAAVALVLGGLGFTVWRISFYESDTERGLTELRAGYSGARPFESRLSNFDYAPFTSVRGNDESTPETLARDRAARKLLDAVRDEPGAASFHALGNYYLTEKQFEKAVAQFDAALRLDANNARLYNDYGVALMEKAQRVSPEERTGKRLENLARAYEFFSRAVELNSSLLEALFNRAAVLEKMNLPQQATRAWLDYLEKDPSSLWAEEARRNLRELETRTVSAKTPERVLADFFAAFGQKDEERAWQVVSQTREMITDTMVFFQLARRFLETNEDGRKEAEQYLAAMRFVGKMEKERAGDFYFAELAEFYASCDRPSRQILSQAQNQVKTGYLLAQNSKYSEAITVFLKAKESFAETGNFWESSVSDFWLGFLRDRSGKIEETVPKFLALIDYCRQRNHKWLAAQYFNASFNFALARNEYSKALNYLNAALKITRENSDTYNRQKILTQLGNYYSRLGEPEKALVQIEESRFAGQDYFTSGRQTWRDCLFAAETLHKLELFNSAIAFGHEALETGSEKITESAADHTSYYMLAQLYGGAGKYAEGIGYAQKSLLSTQSLKENDKRLLTNYSLLRIAHLYRQSGDCEESVKIYSTVIEETVSRQGAAVELELNNYEARKGRLLCRFALKQTDLVEEELAAVLNLYEKFRAEISEEQTRNAFFDDEQGVYDLAVDFERSRNKIVNAFEVAEVSKARSLLNYFRTNGLDKDGENQLNSPISLEPARPLTLGEIQRRLPEAVQLVQYAVLPDKIFIWVVTRTQLHFVETEVASDELKKQIENYLAITAENKPGAGDSREAARRLHQALFSPVLPLLDSKMAVCVVPDKALYRLPFAALVSPTSNRFLVEDYTIFSAPSATMLVLGSEAARRKIAPGIEEKILSVGNPYFDRAAFPDLPELPDAEREAVKIAAFYKTAKTLIGKAADKQAVLSELAGSHVFHFAGHYAVDDASPLRSKLLLALKKTNHPSDMKINEILGQDLRSIKLAVLSACRTGSENYYGGEGMFGIAREFLAGGVPLVVASQWAVDSAATAELMVNFHLHRKRHGLATTEALRRAQLEMLNNENQRLRSPYYWAGFQLFGGYTDD